MFIVTSAQYISPEFISEFGLIPPSFLPVGNKRLYVHQFELFASEPQKYLTLPVGFQIPQFDQRQLAELGVKIIFLDETLSLSQSISQCLSEIPSSSNPIKLLHGDTYIENIDPSSLDIVSIAKTNEYYKWAGLAKQENQTRFTSQYDSRKPDFVLSGYFTFSDRDVLEDALLSNTDFISALNGYANSIPLSPKYFSRWYDFGHLHTYFRSKSKMTTQRAFNDLDISPRIVTKSSTNTQKILAEYTWFKNLPDDMTVFSPKVFGFENNRDISSYKIEYLYMSTLNELAVFADLPGMTWERILDSCNEFMIAAKHHIGPSSLISDINKFHQQKVFTRLNSLKSQNKIDIDSAWQLNGERFPSLLDIAKHCVNDIRPTTQDDICFSHGDFCFSNILYDFRVQSIRVIDPRGSINDCTPTQWGDARYDAAKILHSVIGKYDLIIAGLFDLDIQDEQSLSFTLEQSNCYETLETLANGILFGGYKLNELMPIVINLFISMLPLHYDSHTRQLALIANALQLYKSYLKTGKS